MSFTLESGPYAISVIVAVRGENSNDRQANPWARLAVRALRSPPKKQSVAKLRKSGSKQSAMTKCGYPDDQENTSAAISGIIGDRKQ